MHALSLAGQDPCNHLFTGVVNLETLLFELRSPLDPSNSMVKLNQICNNIDRLALLTCLVRNVCRFQLS